MDQLFSFFMRASILLTINPLHALREPRRGRSDSRQSQALHCSGRVNQNELQRVFHRDPMVCV